MKDIYVVMYAYYSDWEIYGYFSNRADADKYCVAHPEQNCHVEVIPCFDNQENFSNIVLKYEHQVVFNKKDGTWVMSNTPDGYTVYMADYLRSNSISCGIRNDWISLKVNISKDDRKLAEKIAQDFLYQFLDFCNNEPNDTFINQMNEIFSADEKARLVKEQEERIRQNELSLRLSSRSLGGRRTPPTSSISTIIS